MGTIRFPGTTHFPRLSMIDDPTARRIPGLWRQQVKAPREAELAMMGLASRLLEPMIELFCHPVVVVSGYRSPALNGILGGREDSQHVAGQAADLRIAPGFAGRYRDRVAGQLSRELGFDVSPQWSPNLLLWLAFVAFSSSWQVDEAVLEFGDPGNPSWVHVSHSEEPRYLLLGRGDWTGGEYRNMNDLREALPAE